MDPSTSETVDERAARAPGDGDALPWSLFCASLAGLALLVTWSVRHPVRAVPDAPAAAAPSATAPPGAGASAVVEAAGGEGGGDEGGGVPGDPSRPGARPSAGPAVAVAATGGDGVAVGAREADAIAPSTPIEPLRVAILQLDGPSTAGDGATAATGPWRDPEAAGEGAAAGADAGTDAMPRRDEELAALAGLSARLRYAPDDVAPGPTGIAMLARMVGPLSRYPELDVVVSVAGRELAAPADDGVLARARAARLVDLLVDAGLRRERFLIRVEPDASGPMSGPGHRVRVAAVADGA